MLYIIEHENMRFSCIQCCSIKLQCTIHNHPEVLRNLAAVARHTVQFNVVSINSLSRAVWYCPPTIATMQAKFCLTLVSPKISSKLLSMRYMHSVAVDFHRFDFNFLFPLCDLAHL